VRHVVLDAAVRHHCRGWAQRPACRYGRTGARLPEGHALPTPADPLADAHPWRTCPRHSQPREIARPGSAV